MRSCKEEKGTKRLQTRFSVLPVISSCDRSRDSEMKGTERGSKRSLNSALQGMSSEGFSSPAPSRTIMTRHFLSFILLFHPCSFIFFLLISSFGIGDLALFHRRNDNINNRVSTQRSPLLCSRSRLCPSRAISGVLFTCQI